MIKTEKDERIKERAENKRKTRIARENYLFFWNKKGGIR